MTKKQNSGKAIYKWMVDNEAAWTDAAQHFGISEGAARGRVRRYREKHDLPPHIVGRIRGGMDTEPRTSSKDQWTRALDLQEKQDRHIAWKQQRRVIFDAGPVVVIFMADLHLGSNGTDYRSIDRDIALINALKSQGKAVAVVLMGDLLDNFIVGRLRDLRMNQSPFLTIEEWGLVDYALERLSPHLIGSVAGNHDNWSWAISGVDLLRQRHKELTPGILYDPIELAFWLQVGAFECRVMCRHDWRGHSMFNPTHGLEHGHHRLGREFDIGVGAHTHRGGLAREFANGHDTPGHALICGTYKKVDTYAMAKGYPPPLSTSAVAAVIDETGILFSTSNLEALARVL